MYCLASLGGTGGASGDVVLGVEHVVLGGLARAGPAVPGASRVEAVENVLLLGTAGPAGEVASGVKGIENVVLGLGAGAGPAVPLASTKLGRTYGNLGDDGHSKDGWTLNMAIETSPLLGGPANSRKHLIALAILGCTTIFAVAIITQVSVGPTELGAGEWDGWTGSGAEPEDNVFDTLDTTGDFTGWTGGEEEGNVFDSLKLSAPASPGADSVERVENVALLLTASPAGEVASGVKGIENVVLGLGAGAGPAVPLASTKLGRTDGNLGDDGHSKDGSASKDGESDKVLARVGGAAEKRGSFDGHV
eukprot:CAMPEP_0175835086 /NCGR_PEP_ID=MMETSP0107_2-20121207/16402_1 /TAXON_ID=195067 ORGANISM="Goniomonas pacifica, Strain CCMP1869" /NCGR_SAMPLE_ID=MMETSP0107_2 /ASSEMBLY_ACC=CAM_ASM_000203 /LENGTH=305 /DNA_ID=CAMNT_0017148351 /DNA_START=23 /DNA_END=941 /DNA_ORIENTATION=-